MTGNETHDRSRTVVGEPTRPPGSTIRALSAPVLAAYDTVQGTDSFVLAHAERDDAWLAVAAGGERTLREWR